MFPVAPDYVDTAGCGGTAGLSRYPHSAHSLSEVILHISVDKSSSPLQNHYENTPIQIY